MKFSILSLTKYKCYFIIVASLLLPIIQAPVALIFQLTAGSQIVFWLNLSRLLGQPEECYFDLARL